MQLEVDSALAVNDVTGLYDRGCLLLDDEGCPLEGVFNDSEACARKLINSSTSL